MATCVFHCCNTLLNVSIAQNVPMKNDRWADFANKMPFYSVRFVSPEKPTFFRKALFPQVRGGGADAATQFDWVCEDSNPKEGGKSLWTTKTEIEFPINFHNCESFSVVGNLNPSGNPNIRKISLGVKRRIRSPSWINEPLIFIQRP